MLDGEASFTSGPLGRADCRCACWYRRDRKGTGFAFRLQLIPWPLLSVCCVTLHKPPHLSVHLLALRNSRDNHGAV